MKPLKVSQVNSYIKRVFAGDMILSNIEIEGEISNFSKHYSGHMYFSLKDDKGRIRCVMFKSDADFLNVNLSEGQKIIAKGYISVYEKSGDYQLYVKSIKLAGLGDLFKAYEELKIKLEEEGMFKEEYKKELPYMPKKIGVVTSSTGAAVRDIISIINRRSPGTNILLYPSLVQGSNAAEDIIKGLLYLDNRKDVDLIIVGRGGGSIEDLFAFNDESLCRTIFNLKTPIISAVGHETDFTIADFVADLRAATPSAAAEIAVEDIDYLLDNLNGKYVQLISAFSRKMATYENQLHMVNNGLRYNNPINKLRDKKQEIDMILKDIRRAMENTINNNKTKLSSLENRLNLSNPNLLLNKGYGILLNEDDKFINSIEDFKINDKVKIVLKDGWVNTKVLDMGREGYKDESK